MLRALTLRFVLLYVFTSFILLTRSFHSLLPLIGPTPSEGRSTGGFVSERVYVVPGARHEPLSSICTVQNSKKLKEDFSEYLHGAKYKPFTLII